jgi:hypothetical protein
MTKLLSKYKYWIFLWLLFLALRLPSLFEPYWYGDEGIYLTLGQGIRKGLVLYQQIHDNKPPTLYYLAAFAKTVFGFRLMLLVVMAVTVYVFYLLAQKFLSKNLSKIVLILFVVLSSIPLIEGNIANAEIFMLLPTLIAILFFLKTSKNIYLYLSGLFLGLAFTIKIPVFIETFFLIFYLLIVNFSDLKKNFLRYIIKPFLLGIGFITPIIVYFIYFYFLNAFSSFLHSALLQNFSYISSWSTGNQASSASSGGVVQRFIVLILLLSILSFFYFKKIIKREQFLVLGWFFACIFGALLSTRPYPHYLIQVLPSFCLILGFILMKKNYSLKLISLFSFFFFLFIIQKYNFYFYSNLSYYRNFYSHITNLGSVDYSNYFGSSVSTTDQVSNYVKQYTSTNDHIFIWGDEPYIYALSDRLPTGRYTVAYHIVDFNGYSETIESLKVNSPKFIIYFPMENRPFSELDDILTRYYFLDKKIDSALIFQKR